MAEKTHGNPFGFDWQRTAVNPYNTAYPTIDMVHFTNVVSPNAAGRPTEIPVSNMGNVDLPTFNKQNAAKLPSASLIIRSLIRGNSE